jgi:hypothetical protein
MLLLLLLSKRSHGHAAAAAGTGLAAVFCTSFFLKAAVTIRGCVAAATAAAVC